MKRTTPFKTLDAFRGFSALWVVMVHSCDRWLYTGHEKYLSQPLYAFSMHGALGVMLFFVISGYCVTAAGYQTLVNRKSVLSFGYDRLRRIYPPYLAALLLQAVSIATIDFFSARGLIKVNHLQVLPWDWNYWIGNLFLVQYELQSDFVSLSFWSLCYEVAFYALLALLFWLAALVAQKHGLYAGTKTLVIAMGLSSTFTLGWMLLTGWTIFPFGLWHDFLIGGFLFCALELGPDTVAGYSKTLRWLIWTNVAVVVILTLLFAAFRSIGKLDAGHPSSAAQSLMSLSFAVLLFALRRVDGRLASSRLLRPLMALGGFSYSLYLVHTIVLPYVDILCRKAGLDGSRYWITYLLQIGIAILCARVFYEVVEKRFLSKRQMHRLRSEGLLEEAGRRG